MSTIRCLICRCLFLRTIDYLNHQCSRKHQPQ